MSRKLPPELLCLVLVAAACDWPLCDRPCGDGKQCVDGRCVEGPCAQRECGPDGQGGTCGECLGICEAGRCRRCPAEMAFIGDGRCIDRHEASRGDGGAAASAPGVLPWQRPTWLEASQACSTAGKRLCQSDEWTAACTGGKPCMALCRRYPYGEPYQQGRCFGDPLASDPEPTGPLPTGSRKGCEGGFAGIFDLSGNLAEWLDDCDSFTCSTAGGGYGDFESQLRCNSRGSQMQGVREPDWVGDEDGLDIGFRCCLSL